MKEDNFLRASSAVMVKKYIGSLQVELTLAMMLGLGPVVGTMLSLQELREGSD